MQGEFKRHDKEDEATKTNRLAASLMKTKANKTFSPQQAVVPDVGSEVGSFTTLNKRKEGGLEPIHPFTAALPPKAPVPMQDSMPFEVKKPNPVQVGHLNQVKAAFANARVPPGARKAYEEYQWQQEMEKRRFIIESQNSTNKSILVFIGIVAALGAIYFGYGKITEMAQASAKASLMQEFYKSLPPAAPQ